MNNKDYYKILGINCTASDSEIKKAYRRLAKKYHPDVSKEVNAEARFKEVNEAYEVLSHKEKRAEYDAFGSASKAYQSAGDSRSRQTGDTGFGSFSNFGSSGYSNIFDDLFGNGFAGGFNQQGKPKPQNQNATIHVDLEDVFHGSRQSIRLPNGSHVQVKIPAGIESGKKIRLAGKGINGGDLLLKVKINPHKQFKLDGKDILIQVPITPWEAALGTDLTVPTLAGSVKLKIPANTQSGKKMRLKGRGPKGNPPGHQYIIIHIHTPPANTDDEVNAYKMMKNTFSSWNPRDDNYS